MGLAENIKVRRAAKNYSQADLAEKAGVSQQLINALEHGKVGSTKFMPEIAAALGCTIAELEPRFGSPGRSRNLASLDGSGASELPIHAAKELPADPGCVELSAEPVDFMDRPSQLRNVRDCYAVFVADDLMSPEFERGDIVVINPHPPPVAGTTFMFSRDSDGSRLGKIRRLERFTPTEWIVTMWNGDPATTAESALNRNDWQFCHRIVARYCMR